MGAHRSAFAPRDESEAPVEDLVVVAEFRDYIYPGLVSTGKVTRGGDKPFHTVINGENFHALEALTFTHRGKIDIQRWAIETIEKYKFQFKPLSAEERGDETVVSVEVSGTFPGSPVTLDYHFAIANDEIASLTIDS